MKLGELRYRPACEPLIAALGDRYPIVRSNAARALGAIGDAHAVDALTRRREDPKERDSVRQAASEALEALKQAHGSIPEPPSATRPSAEGSRNDAFRADRDETLAAGLRQILEGDQFENVSATTAEEAAAVLFNRAILAIPSLTVQAIKANYETVKGPWSSGKLVTGTQAQVRSIVLENLRRIQSQAGFRKFEIAVRLEHGAAEVEAIVPPFFIPVAVWRSGDDIFACGNSDFRD